MACLAYFGSVRSFVVWRFAFGHGTARETGPETATPDTPTRRPVRIRPIYTPKPESRIQTSDQQRYLARRTLPHDGLRTTSDGLYPGGSGSGGTRSAALGSAGCRAQWGTGVPRTANRRVREADKWCASDAREARVLCLSPRADSSHAERRGYDDWLHMRSIRCALMSCAAVGVCQLPATRTRACGRHS